MRVIFMGSPEFALPTLEALHAEYDLVGVFAQPDRRAGRGRRLKPPAAKQKALELGLSVHQPPSLKDPDAIAKIHDLSPELIVVAAYGQILPPIVLEAPPRGCVNVHGSLLPRWRGAAPVQAAMLHGDETTGTSIMLMDAGLDTGPILARRETPIQPEETAGALSARLAAIGAELLMDTLPPFLQGDIRPSAQDEEQATYAPMLSKRDGLLDFSLDAQRLARQVRAFEPWPGSYLTWAGGRLLVRAAHAVSNEGLPAGTMHLVEGTPAIAAAEGSLVLDYVQPAGRKTMSGDAFVRGAPDFIDDRSRRIHQGP